MPSALRAPLLWLLLPFMAGLGLAEHANAALLPPGLATGLACGGALACGALAFLRRDGRSREWLESMAVLVMAAAAGFCWLPARAPAGLTWTQPAREVELELSIEQVFPPVPGRKTISGLARIVGANTPATAALIGQRVYFSAIRRVSLDPEVSARYRYVGVISPLPRGTATRGFEGYLDALGVRLRLLRGHLRARTTDGSAFQRFCSQAQDRLQKILAHGLQRHPPLVSVYAAMLLGEKALLGGELESAFMRSGVFHIFSISGLHVGVIAGAILSGFKLLRVPPRAAHVVGLAVLWLYVEITGSSVPAQRAFLMIAFLTAGKVFRLPSNPLAGLAGAALTTLLLDPRQLFSTGFQMSYSVVAALVVMGGPLARQAQETWQPWRDLPDGAWSRWQRGLREAGRTVISAVIITWSATLASTPSSIGNFGLFSPGALVANLVVIPLSSIALVAGFVSLLAGLAGALPLCVILNHAAALAIVVMDGIVQRGTELPGVYFAAEFRAPWMGSASLIIVLGSILIAAHPRWRRHALWWLPPAALAATLILGVKFP